MLETRLLCYNDLAKELARSSTNTGAIPPWYSDNISDYWDIAGLPRSISGFFSYQESIDKFVQIPAVLSFVPSQSGQNISGWFFAIGESSDFSFFIESQKSAKTIYSRRGKTPQEQRLRLKCTLYINDGESDGLDVRIKFDGKTFEIREYPSRRSNSLIFRGNF